VRNLAILPPKEKIGHKNIGQIKDKNKGKRGAITP
jgi:hypothetical protein